VPHLLELDRRAKELGGSINFAARSTDITLERIAPLIKNHSNIELLASTLDNHHTGLVRSYITEPKDLSAAKLHARMIAFFGLDSSTPGQRNNYGYLQLALGDLDEARLAFDFAIKSGGPEAALPYFNRGVLELMQGNTEAALDDFRRCLELGERDPVSAHNSVTLFVPTNDGSGTFRFPEKGNLRLFDTVSEVLESMRTNQDSSPIN
jgi:tetratricopeptide (TPR) repeat protein